MARVRALVHRVAPEMPANLHFPTGVIAPAVDRRRPMARGRKAGRTTKAVDTRIGATTARLPGRRLETFPRMLIASAGCANSKS